MDFGIHDGLSAFFAVCFLSGFLLSLVSLLLGTVSHSAHFDGTDTGALDAGQIDATADLSSHDLSLPKHWGTGLHGPLDTVAPVNFSSMMAFAMWFGGFGWILYGFLRHWLLWVLPVAVLGGLAGGAIVYLFIKRVLLPGQRVLRPEDFNLPGTPARVRAEIREGGSGEIAFQQGGMRRVAWARSCDGRGIPAGTEVVIERTEGGFIFVTPLAEMLETSSRPSHERWPGAETRSAREKERS